MTKATSALLACLCFMGLLALSMTAYHDVRSLNDMKVYQRIAGDISQNRESAELESEYPPLAASFFWIVDRQPVVRAFARAWFTCIFAAVAFACAYAAVRLRPTDIAVLPASLLASVILLGPQLHFGYFDVFVMLLLFLAWRSYQGKRYGDSGAFLAVAGCLKLVPFALAPVLFFLTPARDRKRFAVGFLIAGALSTIIPLLIMGPSMMVANVRHMAAYHGSRGIQAETTWSGLDMLYRAMKGDMSIIDPRAGAFDNVSVSPHVVTLSLLLSLAGILALIFWAWKKRASATANASPAFFLTFLWLFAFGSVLSPQYFVWVVPLMLVWGIERVWSEPKSFAWNGAFLVSLSILAVSTQWIFPEHYYEFLNQNNGFNTAVFTLRNVAMFVLVGLLTRRLLSPAHTSEHSR